MLLLGGAVITTPAFAPLCAPPGRPSKRRVPTHRPPSSSATWRFKRSRSSFTASRRSLARLPRHARSAVTLLNTAIAGLEAISHRTAGLPPDVSQAAAHQKLGDMYRIIGRYADAGRH